jgi:hypothetical protein
MKPIAAAIVTTHSRTTRHGRGRRMAGMPVR